MNSIIRYVREKFAQDADVEWILHSGTKNITLIFWSNEHPIVVGKVSRGGGQTLVREYRSLKMLERISSKCALLGKTIPKALALEKLDGNYVLFEEYKCGISGDTYVRTIFWKKRVKKLLHEIVSWLMSFLESTKEYHDTSVEAKRKTLMMWGRGEGMNEYSRRFLEDEKFFSAPSHGDLVIRNILIGKNGKITGVIDFENFAVNGVPILDLMDVIVSTGTTLYGYTREMINNTFFKLNPFSEEIQKCVQDFCRFCELEVKDFIQILPLYSDRAIYYSQRIKNKALLNFHVMLKKMLINEHVAIVWKS